MPLPDGEVFSLADAEADVVEDARPIPAVAERHLGKFDRAADVANRLAVVTDFGRRRDDRPEPLYPWDCDQQFADRQRPLADRGERQTECRVKCEEGAKVMQQLAAGHRLGQGKDEQRRQRRKHRFKALLEISRTLRRDEMTLLLTETLNPDRQRVHGRIRDPQFSDAGEELENHSLQPTLQVKAVAFIRQSGQTDRNHYCNSQHCQRCS